MIKRFSIQLIIRTILVLISCLLLTWFLSEGYWFTVVGLALLIIVQGILLYFYVNETNYSLVRFLDALKNEDHSVYFSASKKGKSFAELFRDFNTIIAIFKKNKVEKEAQHKHFQQILEQISLGIISINKEDLEKIQSDHEILFFNFAAARILDQPQHKYWHRLERQVPWFANEVRQLANGGKKLVDTEVNSTHKQLSLNVINVRFLGIPYLIISFQDIHSEIEQKEIEAWHNVIRVLAHEMLNSFTPVHSLASTIKSMTENGNGKIIKISDLDEDAVKDINLAASTIKKRSKGLMEFVNDYRKISNVPVPVLKPVNLNEFLEGIYRLMDSALTEKGITLKKAVVPSRAVINIDEKLIEQVIINLISNAIFALEETEDPRITVICELNESQTVLHVEDNGKGIPVEIQKQIFIPFFTTRKNGSGIGLSLSKDIMKQHAGRLLVSSEEGEFTRVSLVFDQTV